MSSTLVKSMIVVGALGLMAGGVSASVPWTPSAGSQSEFDYESGTNDTNNLGNPTAVSSGFLFFPSTLDAESNNGVGSPAQSTDTASVILRAKPNLMFTRISTNLLGDFGILSSGSVLAQADVTVRNLDTNQTISSDLMFTPSMPVATPELGQFTGATSVDLPEGWTNIQVSFDALVGANSTQGSTSFIEVKNGSIGVETALIPLPAGALAAIPAVFIAYRARRKLGTK